LVDIDALVFEFDRKEFEMPREKSYKEMTDDERDQHKRDNHRR